MMLQKLSKAQKPGGGSQPLGGVSKFLLATLVLSIIVCMFSVLKVAFSIIYILHCESEPQTKRYQFLKRIWFEYMEKVVVTSIDTAFKRLGIDT